MLSRVLSRVLPQVNGLRQERTEHVMCPGHVYGVNSFDTRTLVGNWAEERCDKAYVPSLAKMPSGNDWQWRTTSAEMTANLAHKVLPGKASNSDTLYTHFSSKVRAAHGPHMPSQDTATRRSWPSHAKLRPRDPPSPSHAKPNTPSQDPAPSLALTCQAATSALSLSPCAVL